MNKTKFSLRFLLGVLTFSCFLSVILSRLWVKEPSTARPMMIPEIWQTYSPEKFRRATSRNENVLVYVEDNSPPYLSTVPEFHFVDSVELEEFAISEGFTLFHIDFAFSDVAANRFFRLCNVGKPIPDLPIVIIYLEGKFYKYFPVRLDRDFEFDLVGLLKDAIEKGGQ